jgi:hypothetical protein
VLSTSQSKFPHAFLQDDPSSMLPPEIRLWAEYPDAAIRPRPFEYIASSRKGELEYSQCKYPMQAHLVPWQALGRNEKYILDPITRRASETGLGSHVLVRPLSTSGSKTVVDRFFPHSG